MEKASFVTVGKINETKEKPKLFQSHRKKQNLFLCGGGRWEGFFFNHKVFYHLLPPSSSPVTRPEHTDLRICQPPRDRRG